MVLQEMRVDGRGGREEGTTVHVRTYTPSQISLETDGSRTDNGYVVVSDIWAPGWEA